jgi:outer membrane protein
MKKFFTIPSFGLVCSGLLFCLAPGGYATEIPSNPLPASKNLWQIFQLSAQNNAAIHANQKVSDASLDSYLSSFAGLFPQLSATATVKKDHYDGLASGTYDAASYTASATQVLFNPVLFMTVLSRYHTAQSSSLLYRYQYQQFIQLVTQRYFAVLKAADQVNVDNANVDNLKMAYDQALAQYKVGVLVETSVKQAEAKYKQAQATKIQDENILQSSKQQLQAVTGLPVGTLYPLKSNLVFHFPEPNSLDQWLTIGLSNNQNLKAAEQTVLSNRATFESDVGAWLPSVALVLSVTDTNAHLDGDADVISALSLSHSIDRKVAFDFTWNLFGGPTGANPYSIEKGAAIYEAAQDTKRQTYRNTRASIIGDFNHVTADLQSISRYQAAVEANQVALNQYQARFKAGLSTMLEVLQGVDALYQAQSQYLQSEYQFINDEIQLKLDVGTLSEKDLQSLNTLLVN